MVNVFLALFLPKKNDKARNIFAPCQTTSVELSAMHAKRR